METFFEEDFSENLIEKHLGSYKEKGWMTSEENFSRVYVGGSAFIFDGNNSFVLEGNREISFSLVLDLRCIHAWDITFSQFIENVHNGFSSDLIPTHIQEVLRDNTLERNEQKIILSHLQFRLLKKKYKSAVDENTIHYIYELIDALDVYKKIPTHKNFQKKSVQLMLQDYAPQKGNIWDGNSSPNLKKKKHVFQKKWIPALAAFGFLVVGVAFVGGSQNIFKANVSSVSLNLQGELHGAASHKNNSLEQCVEESLSTYLGTKNKEVVMNCFD